MLLALLKKSRKAGYFLFPVFIGVAWVKHFLEPYTPRFAEGEARFGLFGIIDSLTGSDLRLKTALVLILLLFSGLLLFRIYREYLFPNSWSMLPAVLYVLLTSGNPGYQALHPVWFAIPFLLGAIDRLFVAFDVRKPYGHLFNSGFLLGMGSLFYPFLLVVFPAPGNGYPLDLPRFGLFPDRPFLGIYKLPDHFRIFIQRKYRSGYSLDVLFYLHRIADPGRELHDHPATGQ